MSDRDETQLGRILVKMGALTEEELETAIEAQERSSKEEILGNLLIAYDVCTREQVDMALAAQNGLRSEQKVDKAVATADIASYRKRRINDRREDVIDRADRATGGGYPAVTVALAAKGSD